MTDSQMPYQKVTIITEDFGTGLTDKVIFHKTSHLLLKTEPIIDNLSGGMYVAITMKSFPLLDDETFGVTYLSEEGHDSNTSH